MLTGEYFVLDGALALALPTKFGQRLEVSTNESSDFLDWQSLDSAGNTWFSAHFSLPTLSVIGRKDNEISLRLEALLKTAHLLNPSFPGSKGAKACAFLEFPREWGLGSSSTLVYLLAQWAKVNPFDLLKNTFGGSGYDIACAAANGPILYQKGKEEAFWERVSFAPPFRENLYFVYLDKKQNSREGIARYREKVKNSPRLLDEISNLSAQILKTANLEDFEKIIACHESIIADALKLSRAKPLYFQDFWGEIKSLGAWGGDFVLATGNRTFEETKKYFQTKGLEVIFKFDDLILNSTK